MTEFVKTAGLVRRIGKPAFGVLNFAPPNSRSHEETARAVLDTIPLPLASVVLHRYDVHRLANIKGLTAQEMEPDSIAADEISVAVGLAQCNFAIEHKCNCAQRSGMKKPTKAADFLQNMAHDLPASTRPEVNEQGKNKRDNSKDLRLPNSHRPVKHIGGYLYMETVENINPFRALSRPR